MWLAAAIVFCAVLFLVDKNRAWKKFWIVTGGLVLSCILLIIGYVYWDAQGAKKYEQSIQRVAQIREAQQRECTTGDAFDRVACEKAVEVGLSSSSALKKSVAGYVAMYGSCPDTEAPNWDLDNPCPNSVIPAKAPANRSSQAH